MSLSNKQRKGLVRGAAVAAQTEALDEKRVQLVDFVLGYGRSFVLQSRSKQVLLYICVYVRIYACTCVCVCVCMISSMPLKHDVVLQRKQKHASTFMLRWTPQINAHPYAHLIDIEQRA